MMKLVLVGLPLGNIQDISLRAIKTLKESKVIICEDSRVFNRLWQKLINLGYIDSKFEGKIFVLNEFNESKKYVDLGQKIKDEKEVVLVSDAGMPLISDPGFRLVNEVIDQKGEIEVIPGPTAMTAAIALSGLSTDKILFLGFLPKKLIKRETIFLDIKKWKGKGMTVICYESPKRLNKRLIELEKYFDESTKVVVARELTKKYQEVDRGSLREMIKKFSDKKIKGEVVLLWRV